MHVLKSFSISPTVGVIAVISEEKPVTQIPRGASKSEAESGSPFLSLAGVGMLVYVIQELYHSSVPALPSQCHLISGTRYRTLDSKGKSNRIYSHGIPTHFAD